MYSNVISSSIFDPKPLQKKIERNKKQDQLKYFLKIFRKNLEHAISQCITSYILTSFKKQLQKEFQTKTSHSKIQAISKQLWNDSNVLKIACENVNSKIKQVIKTFPCFLQSQIQELTSKVFDTLQKSFSNNENIPRRKTQEKQERYLSESNKNFLIELFTDFGLLKGYREIDRTFVRLVQQAQKAYYKIQPLMEERSRDLQMSYFSKRENQFQSNDEVNVHLIEAANNFSSTKKRLRQAQYKLEKRLYFDPIVKGYSPKDSSTYFSQESTKEGTNLFQQSTHQPSLSRCLKYSTSHFLNQNQEEPKPSGLYYFHDQIFNKIKINLQENQTQRKIEKD